MSVSFQTNKTGAAATVCTTATIKYNFSVAQNTTAAAATFAMSKGSSTTASCTVAIYNQPNGGGSVVASVSLPASAFSSSSYPDVVFTFPANTNLTANTNYSLVISSSTGCNGATAYSMKPGSFQVIDTATAQVLNTGYAISAAPTGSVTATATATGSFALSSANIAVSAFSSALTVNKNYTVAAQVNAVSRVDAAATVDMAATVSANTLAHMDAAATCEYELTSNSIARALLFASTEPYLFVESALACVSFVAATAEQDIAAQTIAAVVVTATASGQVQIANVSQFYIGSQRVTNLYIGAISITKAYVGDTLLLEQPN